MPARLNAQIRVGKGKRTVVVGNDNDWRFGPAEGWWFVGMFTFAVAVLLWVLVWPWCYETVTGRSWRFRQNAQQQQLYQPQDGWTAVPLDDNSFSEDGELSAEELDRRHSERILRNQGR
jgi:hypothetical protein